MNRRESFSSVRFLGYCLLLLSIFSLSSNIAIAQWREIKPFRQTGDNSVGSIYVLPADKNIIFAGMFNSGDSVELWKSFDHGKNWNRVFKSKLWFENSVTSIVFKDSLTGWFSTFGIGRNFSGCYKTTDGGETWNSLIGCNGDSWGVYFHPYNQKLFLCKGYQTTDGIQVSDDYGANWTSLGTPPPSATTGIVFIDDVHGVMTSTSLLMYLTTDGGNSWWPNGFPDSGSIQPTAINKTIFFSQTAGIDRAYGTTIFSINKWGDLPNQISSFWLNTTGSIFTDSINLYIQLSDLIQNDALSFSGIQKSTDEGITWHSICGPTNRIGTRFYVDSTGEIWAGQMINYYHYAGLWYNPTGRPNGPRVLIDGAGASRDIGIRTGEAVPVEFSYPDDTYFEAIDSVSMIVNYSSGLAYLRDSVSLGWVVIRKEISDTAIRFILRRLDTDAPAAHSGILKVYFQTYLSIDTSATVSLDEVAFNQDNAARACMLSDLNASDSIHISFLDRCGDSTLRNFLRELEPIKIISVTPNPSSGIVQLDYSVAESQTVTIEVFDILGNQVLSEERTSTNGKNHTAINLESYPNGTYYLRLTTGNESVSSKVVKE